jgi:hypothetical protein
MIQSQQIKKHRFLPAALAVAFSVVGCAVAASAGAAAVDKPKLIQRTDKAPISDELRKWMADNKIKSLVFVDEDSQVQVVNTDGVDIPVCGRDEGVGIPEACDFSGITPTTSNALTLLGYKPPVAAHAQNKKSLGGPAVAADPCTWVIIGGAWIKYCW